MNTDNRDIQSESEKEIEDVELLVESIKYQKDDPSQQQQALRALGDILSQNSKSVIINVFTCKVHLNVSLCRLCHSRRIFLI